MTRWMISLFLVGEVYDQVDASFFLSVRFTTRWMDESFPIP